MNGEATEISNLKGYIWKSVKYASLKHVNRSKRLVPLKENTPVFTLYEEERLDQDVGPKLRSAMDKLPEQCKNVFEICALDGQKYRTAANSLGISVNTVKTQMKKAYRILRYDLRNGYSIMLLLGIIHQLLP
jgi:RNA polymerase sigma-70 factor (ECF subfamily)